MKKIIPFLAIMVLFVSGCSEDVEDENLTEASCSTATGTWVVSGATCNSVAVSSLGSVSMTFNSLTSVTQSQGETACLSSFNLDAAFGSFSPTLDLTGNGNLSCSANGSSVSSCTGTTNNCDSTTNITGFRNSFSTCAIASGVMSMTRTVSAASNPDDTSYCAEGEEEVVSLSPATDTTSDVAVLSIAGSDPYNFGSVGVGGSGTTTLTLNNSGTVSGTSIAASGLAAPFDFLGGSYPGTGGDCGATLAASASCSIVVEFSPAATGAAVDSLSLSYNDGQAAQSLNHGLSGTGISGSVGNLIISDGPTYDYGTQAVGSTSSKTFTVTNSGSGTASSIAGSGLASPFNFQGGTYPGTGGTCGTALVAAANCTIVVEFAPGLAGLNADTINLDYNDGSSAQTATRNVQGTGAVPAVLFISEADPYDYGSVSLFTINTHTFTVTNAGGFTASALSEVGLVTPFSFSGGAYPGTGGTCGLTLAAAGACNIVIEFSPSVLGISNDTINLNYNDGVSAQSATRDVTGTGIP